MFIDKKLVGYKPGDTEFKKDDVLLSVQELQEYMDGSEQVSLIVTRGAAVWNVIHQGDHEDAGYFLGVQGDPRSDWIHLYQMDAAQKDRWNNTTSFGGKDLGQNACFNLLLEADTILGGAELPDSLIEHMGKPGPSLTKCLVAGMASMLTPEAMVPLALLPGVGPMISTILQLRQ